MATRPVRGPSGELSADEIAELGGSLHETLQTACPVQEPVVEGLIDRGQIVVIAARPGTGKTPLLTQLVSAVSVGKPFLDFATRQCRGAIIDLESSPARHREQMQRQWRTMSIGDEAARNIDAFVRGNADDPNSRELDRVLTKCSHVQRWIWLKKVATRRGYGLIVVDTALAFTPFKAADEEKTRSLFSWASGLRQAPSHPAIVLVLHLRKPDRKTPTPKLLEDPYSWTDEFLGSGVWSASADVRLGLENIGKDDHVAFAGFRRGNGEVSPRIIEPQVEELDGHDHPTIWKLVEPSLAVGSVINGTQLARFNKLPVGQEVTWSDFLNVTGAPKVSASRLIQRATAAGVLDYDPSRKTYRRRV